MTAAKVIVTNAVKDFLFQIHHHLPQEIHKVWIGNFRWRLQESCSWHFLPAADTDNVTVVGCTCMGCGEKQVWSMYGNWEENKAEGQKKKEHQGQDSSIAVLNMRRRRCCRIEPVRDGAAGDQGTQPGLLIGKKGLLSNVIMQKCCSAFTPAISTSKKAVGGALQCLFSWVGKMWTYTLKKEKRWSPVTYV